MAIPLAIPIILAGMQLLKSRQDQENWKSDMLVNAERERGSYWTKQPSHQTGPRPSPWEGVASGALGGYQAAQSMEMADKNTKFQQKYMQDQQKINAHLAGMPSSAQPDNSWMGLREGDYYPNAESLRVRDKYNLGYGG